MHSFLRLCLGLTGCLLLASASITIGQDGKLIISTTEETAQEMAAVPCKNGERLKAAKALFLKLGARPEDVQVEKSRGVENLVVRKPGQSEETLVLGAHYDKSPAGCGAIDNWTGVVAVAHIYRSLKDVPLQKSVTFVAFGREEEGLLGAKEMVRQIKKEEIGRYCAMVNIDSLGMAAPQVLENLSSQTLVGRVEALAQRLKLPFSRVKIPEAGADSRAFLAKGIPAVTISAIAPGWGKVLHTANDQAAKVDTASLYLGYRLALALVAELDRLPCSASREEGKAK